MLRDIIDIITGSNEYAEEPETRREIVLEEVSEAEQLGMIPSLDGTDIYERRGQVLVRRVAGRAGERHHQLGLVTSGPPYIVDGSINTEGMTVNIEPSFMKAYPHHGNMPLNGARTKGYKAFRDTSELKDWMVEARGQESLRPLVADTVDRSMHILQGKVL